MSAIDSLSGIFSDLALPSRCCERPFWSPDYCGTSPKLMSPDACFGVGTGFRGNNAWEACHHNPGPLPNSWH